ANATMMKTITVVMIVSRRVGQVTFEVSERTCWRNSSGLVFAISLLKCPLQHPARWSHSRSSGPGPLPGLPPAALGSGRSGGARTPNPRFWRPVLYQLSYTPKGCRRSGNLDFVLLQHLGDDAGADGAAAFADGEAELLFHRDRRDERHVHLHVVARHDHFRAFRKRHDTRDVRRAEIELRTVVREERRVTATLFRSEERRVGKEWRTGRPPDEHKKKTTQESDK